MKRFFDDARNILDVHHQVTVFDDRQGHTEHVGLLESALADHRAGHLSRDGDHRDGIQERVSDTGHQIRRAGTAGGETNAGFAAGPCVGLRGERFTLLVPGQDRADLLRARQGLMQFHAGTPGVAEHDLHAFPLQAVDNNVRPAHQGPFFSSTFDLRCCCLCPFLGRDIRILWHKTMKSYGIWTPAYTPPAAMNQRKLPTTGSRGPEPGNASMHFTC